MIRIKGTDQIAEIKIMGSKAFFYVFYDSNFRSVQCASSDIDPLHWLQGDQIHIAVFFWYLVKVKVYASLQVYTGKSVFTR